MPRQFELPLHDDDQLIDTHWLSEWAIKEKFCWVIPGTEFFLHSRSGEPYLWSINETVPGDEITYCYVRHRNELARMLDLLIPDDDGADPNPPYPNWDQLTDAQKDEAIRKAV